MTAAALAASVVADALGPYLASDAVVETAVVGTSTARARDELTFGLFAEQRRGTADGAAPGVVGRNDHQRVRSVRPGKAREVPKVVVVEPIADRDERVGVRGRDRLDDRGVDRCGAGDDRANRRRRSRRSRLGFGDGQLCLHLIDELLCGLVAEFVKEQDADRGASAPH